MELMSIYVYLKIRIKSYNVEKTVYTMPSLRRFSIWHTSSDLKPTKSQLQKTFQVEACVW